jgi:HTH-type transcriptional repressor of NAD biosynthesis genes
MVSLTGDLSLVNRALVFGKFYPPHSGHLALIDFARSKCDELTVLICCSNKEVIDQRIRQSWLSESIDDKSNLDIQVYSYDEEDLPNTSESSREVSSVWAAVFIKLFPAINIIVSSERYGQYVAGAMNIQHLEYDISRNNHPISSSQIKFDLLKYWEFLAPGAQRYFQKKVTLLGTESTGKSTLAKLLASHYSGSLVEEIGREVISNSEEYSKDSLLEIVDLHAKNIDSAVSVMSPLIVIDTDVYITQSYSMFAFGEYLDLSDWVYSANRADLRLYLESSVGFFQDGTRMAKSQREKLDICHQNTLDHFDIDIHELTGSYEQRNEIAHQAIRHLLD